MCKSTSFLDIKYLGSELNKMNQHSQRHLITCTYNFQMFDVSCIFLTKSKQNHDTRNNSVSHRT